MLSNRNTPFDADGFALLVEDMRRLAKHVYGGSNDLNAEAESVSQENETGDDALDEHIAAADPHPQYQLLADVVAPFTVSYLTASGSGTDNVSGLTQVTAFAAASGTLAASFSGGTFTAPADGLYLATLSVSFAGITSGAGTISSRLYTSAGFSMSRIECSIGSGVNAVHALMVAESVYLLAGQTIQFYVTDTCTAGFTATPTVNVNYLSIARLL